MEQPTNETNNPNNSSKVVSTVGKTIFAIFILILVIGGTIFIAKTKPEILGIQNQNIQADQDEIKSLLDEVSKIIVLPNGETPTIATVTELDKVKDQDFFKNAQNGDKILIYSQSKKAYLYRESEKRIIEVGVVNLGQPATDTENTESNNIQPEINPTVVPIPTNTTVPSTQPSSPLP